MVGASATASSSTGAVRVTVEVVVEPTPVTAEHPPEEGTEWEVLNPPGPPTLEAAVRDRLAGRLSSRQAKGTPVTRITSAWQAGVDSRGLDLRTTDLVRPKSLGIQNSCWLGITVDYEAWCVSKRRQADQRLKQQPSTRLVAFASQAEAEAYCLGLDIPFPACS